MKTEVLTWSEAFRLIGKSHSIIKSLVTAGLIRRVERGRYLASDVYRVVNSKKEGYKPAQAAKILKCSYGDVLVLARYGLIKRVLPAYNRSNFTVESVRAAEQARVEEAKRRNQRQ